MATIPIAQSTKKLQPQAQAPRVTPGSITSGGKELAEVGESLLNIEESIQKVNNLRQSTEATTSANVELGKVNAEATQDPRLFDNQQGYYDRIDQIGANASQGIQDPVTRLTFEKSISTRTVNSKFAIGREAIRNLAASTKESLNVFSEQQKLAYNQAQTPAERDMIVKSTIKPFDAALESGAITQKTYNDKVNSINDDFETTRMDAMIESNPPAALATMIRKEDNFSSADLKKEYREKSEKALEKMTAEGQLQLVNQEDQTEIDDIRLLVRGELTSHNMDQQTEAGILLPEVRELLDENKLSSVAQSAPTDDKLFGKLWIRSTQDDMTSKDARELMTDVIRANTLGKLSRLDMERIVGKFSADFQADANKRENGFWRQQYNAVSGFFGRMDWGERKDKATAEVMRAIIDRVNKDNVPFSEIDKVKNDFIKEAVKRKRPSVSNLQDVPNSVANAKAGVRKVFEAPTELKAVAAVADDRQFTQEDLEFTAAEEGITVAEVLKRLGATGDATKPAKGTE